MLVNTRPHFSLYSQKTGRRQIDLMAQNDLSDFQQDGVEILNNVEPCDGISLALLDTRRVWTDGSVPKITVFSDLDSPGKHNGAMIHDNQRFDNRISSEVLNNREKMKIKVIQGTITKPDLTFGELKRLGCSSEGFVIDDLRRVLWPRLLEITDDEFRNVKNLDIIHKAVPDDVYQQISKDIARSRGHLSPHATEKEVERFQQEMTQLICWVLYRQPSLNYYQGYNDIAATVLLVMGLQKSLFVLERLTMKFLERFMEKTMEKVNQELFYIFALLGREHPTLLEHLENVELFPHFALAEYTTWYAHKYAENRKLLHRLFDYFLCAPLLLPLYLSTAIVAFRDTEIFNTTPDMGHTHKVLCTLSDTLPFEKLLVDAKNMYQQYPPESISNDVREYDYKRRRKEQEWKAKSEENRKERERQRQLQVVRRTQPRIPYGIRSVKTFSVVAILAIGLYAFLKSSSGLN